MSFAYRDTQIVFRAKGQNIEGNRITIAFDDYEIDRTNLCNDSIMLKDQDTNCLNSLIKETVDNVLD